MYPLELRHLYEATSMKFHSLFNVMYIFHFYLLTLKWFLIGFLRNLPWFKKTRLERPVLHFYHTINLSEHIFGDSSSGGHILLLLRYEIMT